MAESSHDPFWPELRRRGLIGAAAPHPLGAGNLDRRTADARTLYRIALPDGRPAKLTVARDLTSLCSRASAWRTACPALAGASLFRVQLGEHDLFAEDFFEGTALETAVLQRTLPLAQLHRAFLAVTTALRNTRQPSTDALRRAEWDTWSAEILALPLWSAADLAFLQSQLLPSLAASLLAGPSIRQQVHGDLTDTNLLLSATAQPRLIDLEFTAETHFFATEAARFHALSRSAAAQPGLFAALFPEPGAANQIHFWLTQIQREATHNEPAYLTRWLAHRLAVIRRLLATLSPSVFAACPWSDSPEVAAPARDTAQLFWSIDTVWDERHSTRIAFNPDRPQSLFFPVADRPQPWRLDPASSSAPTVVRRLTAYSVSHDLLVEFGPTELHALTKLPLEDTTLTCVPTGLVVSSPRGDPQFAFSLPSSAADLQGFPVWQASCRSVPGGPPSASTRDAPTQNEKLCAEPTTEKSPAWLEVEIARAAPPALTFRLEDARWSGQPAPTALRLGGWCLAPNDTALSSIQARVAEKVLATSALLPRPDVRLAFPTHPEADHSGFALDLPLVDDLAFLELVAVMNSGATIPFHTVPAGDLPHRGPIHGDYTAWARRYDPDPPAPASPAPSALRFSVLLPTYNTPENFLRACVDSVRAQHHAAWELCVVDDGSSADWIEPYFTAAARTDPRIRFQRRATNGGISRATNDALALATGDFVVFLDHDDLLRPHALAEFARKLAAEPTLDALYSDEDKISADGQRLVPFLKPDFSPEFLLGVMCVGHALGVRTSVARAAGGFDPAFDGVQDYEFLLRVTEQTRRLGHLARILYHWRQSPSSSALHGNVKGDMDARQLAAVSAHLRRTGDTRAVSALGGHRVRLAPSETPPARVALLLAWPADAVVTGCAWSGLFPRDVPVHALSRLPLPASLAGVQRLPTDGLGAALRHLASPASGDVLLVFTAPPLDLPPDWLPALATLAARPDSGLVAPVLLSAENKVLESGWTLGPAGAHPLMRGFDPSGDGYNGSLRCTREVAAVSPLCFALRREFLAQLPPAIESTAWFDFCERLRARGFFHRVCASVHVRVPHSWRAAASALPARTPAPADPCFNPHFDPSRADYTLAAPPAQLLTPPASFHWHLDLPPPANLPDGCLAIRGWCFRTGHTPVHVRLTVAGLTWLTRCDQPRPDVAAQFPQLVADACGFVLRLRLPPGQHRLELHAVDDPDRASELLVASTVVVPRFAALHRLFGQAPAHRVAFQFLAGPSHAPRPLRPEKFPPLSVADSPRGTWPKFTVVTPSFQQARFLEETLRSVLDQPDVRCDYLVQDGGSTDGSVDLIRRFAPQLFASESTRDRGQSDAIARAFAKSTGAPTDLMAWLNSDDFYLPGTLAFVADYFARHPDVDVLYGNRVVVDEASREIGRWFLPAHDPAVLRLNDFVPQETLFWRRRIWDAVGSLDASLKFAMDWDLLLRFDRAGAKIVHVPYFLACFRVHAAQKTSSVLHDLGQREIDALRLRTFGRSLAPAEIEGAPYLQRYLRRSAQLEFLARGFGLRRS